MSKGMQLITVERLERGLEFIKQVAYKVSLRWLFYRLLQEGLYNDKDSYRKYVQLMSRARHDRLLGWHPDMLTDETRNIIYRTFGSRTVSEAAEGLIPSIVEDVKINLDHFFHQEEFVMVLFEARAMAQQFEHYTKNVDLFPFGGDTSIPLKYECGQYLQKMSEYYEKPVRVLYFGDLDDKGAEIYENGMRHIQKWCACPINTVWCGLTPAQQDHYGVPEDPENPGKFQWEAIKDADAAEIINEAMAQYIDVAVLERIEKQSEEQTKIWREKIEKALEPLKPKGEQ